MDSNIKITSKIVEIYTLIIILLGIAFCSHLLTGIILGTFFGILFIFVLIFYKFINISNFTVLLDKILILSIFFLMFFYFMYFQIISDVAYQTFLEIITFRLYRGSDIEEQIMKSNQILSINLIWTTFCFILAIIQRSKYAEALKKLKEEKDTINTLG